MSPNVPLFPTTMATRATDGRYLNAAGIPTYGVSGMSYQAGDDHSHGLNDHIRTRSRYEARDFLYELTKRYTSS